MSEEEKKELEHIKKRAEYVSKNILGTNIFTTYDIHCVNILIEIIEKQQKEIEDLKEELQNVNIKNMELIEKDNYWKTEAIPKKAINLLYISKDKIREKIKEYQNKLFQDIEENKVVEYENIIQVLEELLEE